MPRKARQPWTKEQKEAHSKKLREIRAKKKNTKSVFNQKGVFTLNSWQERNLIHEEYTSIKMLLSDLFFGIEWGSKYPISITFKNKSICNSEDFSKLYQRLLDSHLDIDQLVSELIDLPIQLEVKEPALGVV